jgi:hypothetical protein
MSGNHNPGGGEADPARTCTMMGLLRPQAAWGDDQEDQAQPGWWLIALISHINDGEKSPPFLKGGKGGLNNRLIIPLNPSLRKGDFKYPVMAAMLVLSSGYCDRFPSSTGERQARAS